MAGGDVCGDNRFEIIARAKQAILEGTNIDTSPDEMKVLDNFLFRCWQMDWLDKYESKAWIPCSERLPEDGQTVIFTAEEVVEDDGSKFVEAGVYDAKKGWCYNDGYFPNAFTFVAWMPLPEPYKEQNNE